MAPTVSPSHGAVFLTGATGFVGMEILARYLERTDRPVYAAVRGRDAAEADDAAARRRGVHVRATRTRSPTDCTPCPPTSSAPRLGLSDSQREQLAERVTRHRALGRLGLVHACRWTRSREINVRGHAAHARAGASCASVAAACAATRTSPPPTWRARIAASSREEQLDVGQEFRNPYEQSKFEAERLVRAQVGRLPIQIFRPSIVVGERTTGWTASFNVLYTPLKAFVRGSLPALPARRSAPVDVVPGRLRRRCRVQALE